MQQSLQQELLSNYKDIPLPSLQQLTKNQLSGKQRVQINFKAIPFDAFMQWLNHLLQKYRLSVEKLQSQRLEHQPGWAKLNLEIGTK